MLTYKDMQDFYETNTKRAKKVKIVCIGDSITGWHPDPVERWPFTTYPQVLETLVGAEIGVIGTAGERSTKALEKTELAKQLFPSAKNIILEYGANDFADFTNPTIASATVLTNLKYAINELRGYKVFLVNVIPIRYEDEFKDLVYYKIVREKHSRNLRKFAVHHRARFIDISGIPQAMIGRPTFDYLHPTLEGAEYIANEVFRALTRGQGKSPNTPHKS